MQFFAAHQLDRQGSRRNSVDRDDGDAFPVDVHGDPVTIPTLSEEDADLMARIIQERNLRSNPLTTPLRAIRCEDEGDETPGSKVRLLSEDKGDSGERLKAFMPVLTWLPELKNRNIKDILTSDVIAGLTVGVMLVPQSMSYASIAGLQYVYGMYSGFVPVVVYALFGASRQLAVGPVAMVSLLVEAGLQGVLSEDQCPEFYHDNPNEMAQSELCPDEYARLVFVCALVVGVLQLVARILRLGFLVSFLGHPVVSGFTSAAAIIIGLSQLKYLLGYKIAKSEFVTETMISIFSQIHKTKILTLFLGVLCIMFLMGIKKVSRKVKKLWWLASLGPLVSCIVGILLLSLSEDLRNSVSYVGKIPTGLPPLSVDWDLSLIGKVLPTSITCMLIGYMESIAIGKSLAAKHKYELDAGQELFALGVCNLVGSMFSCYPVTGSFSRSAVNNAMGAKSALAGLVTAIVMFFTLWFLAPIFFYLPEFVLAAIVISSIIPLVAYQEAIHLWKIRKLDFLLWVTAFLGTMVLGVLLGILVATLLSLLIVIYESVRPQLTVLWRIPGTAIYRNVKQESSGAFICGVFIVRIGSSLYFANSSFVKDMLFNYVKDISAVMHVEYIVIEMTPVISIDSTAVHAMQDVIQDFRGRGVQVAFAMIGNRVEKTMRKAKLLKLLGTQWVFPTVHEAVQYCLQHQHAKAQALKSIPALDNKGTDDFEKAIDKEMQKAHVAFGNEFGLSNDMHHQYTTVYLNSELDHPGLLNEVTSLFIKHRVNIINAHVQSQGTATVHTYWIQSQRKGCKLNEEEMDRLREDIKELHAGLPTLAGTVVNCSASEHAEDDRIKQLEQSLAQQSEVTRALQIAILEQSNAFKILADPSIDASEKTLVLQTLPKIQVSGDGETQSELQSTWQHQHQHSSIDEALPPPSPHKQEPLTDSETISPCHITIGSMESEQSKTEVEYENAVAEAQQAQWALSEELHRSQTLCLQLQTSKAEQEKVKGELLSSQAEVARIRQEAAVFEAEIAQLRTMLDVEKEAHRKDLLVEEELKQQMVLLQAELQEAKAALLRKQKAASEQQFVLQYNREVDRLRSVVKSEALDKFEQATALRQMQSEPSEVARKFAADYLLELYKVKVCSLESQANNTNNELSTCKRSWISSFDVVDEDRVCSMAKLYTAIGDYEVSRRREMRNLREELQASENALLDSVRAQRELEHQCNLSGDELWTAQQSLSIAIEQKKLYQEEFLVAQHSYEGEQKSCATPSLVGIARIEKELEAFLQDSNGHAHVELAQALDLISNYRTIIEETPGQLPGRQGVPPSDAVPEVVTDQL